MQAYIEYYLLAAATFTTVYISIAIIYDARMDREAARQKARKG